MGMLGDIVQMNIGQMFQTPSLPKADFSGKTIVVTGSNTGLGLQAAKHIRSLNASLLIIACRDAAKGERARTELMASKTQKTGEIEVWLVDMSNYGSVVAFGNRLKGLSRLDALICNAGRDIKHWELAEGAESMVTINVVSTLLLAMLAYPKLRTTAEAHGQPTYLSFTGSVMHIFGKDQYLSSPESGKIFTSLNDEARADMTDRYNLSKLLLLLGVRSLAGHVESKTKGNPVVVNFINPGWCKTDLFRSNEFTFGERLGLRLMGRTSEVGSRTAVHGIAAGQISHGKYLSECRIKPESSFVRSDRGKTTEQRVWSELLEILEGISPGITDI